MLAHLSVLLNLVTGFLGIVAALVIYLILKDRSRYVGSQAMQAFVFQLVFWAGGGVAIGAVTALSGEFPRELALAALGVGAVAVLFTLAAALIPALALRRIPAARLLAED